MLYRKILLDKALTHHGIELIHEIHGISFLLERRAQMIIKNTPALVGNISMLCTENEEKHFWKSRLITQPLDE